MPLVWSAGSWFPPPPCPPERSKPDRRTDRTATSGHEHRVESEEAEEPEDGVQDAVAGRLRQAVAQEELGNFGGLKLHELSFDLAADFRDRHPRLPGEAGDAELLRGTPEPGRHFVARGA